jgi:hypothetical protein
MAEFNRVERAACTLPTCLKGPAFAGLFDDCFIADIQKCPLSLNMSGWTGLTRFNDLSAAAATKAARAARRLELGNTSSVKWIGVIGEYRIGWGPGYRI